MGGVLQLNGRVRGLEDLLASAWKVRGEGVTFAVMYRSHAQQNAEEIQQ